jgi:hypothetical protein
MSDFIVYVLYYDDYSKAYAQLHYGGYSWARLYRTTTQKYFESDFIVNVLPTLRDEWGYKKYVGVISWKANQKVVVDEKVLQDRMQQNPDVIALGMFKPPHPSGDMIGWAQHCHPHFTELWTQMCEHLEYSSDLYLRKDIPAFYYNYWLMKPDVLDMYLKEAKKAYDYLETEPTIQGKLHEDSKYAMSEPRDGMTYLTYHCFLLERLPCIFVLGKNLQLLPTYIKTL